MAKIKKPPFVAVATERWVEATCMSRYLNVHGVPSAVHPAGSWKLDVRVGSKLEKKAKKLLSSRKRGDCVQINYKRYKRGKSAK
jgi:hypothetical protein